MPRHFRLRERVEDAEARVHDPCVDARERMACYTGPGRLAASQVLRREGAVFEKTANARRTRVILDCGGLQRTATICRSSGSGAVTEAKEGECRFSGVRAGRQRRSTTHAPNVECWPALARALPGVRAMALRDGLRRGGRATPERSSAGSRRVLRLDRELLGEAIDLWP